MKQESIFLKYANMQRRDEKLPENVKVSLERTPNGGSFSVALSSDKFIEIHECDDNGNSIYKTYEMRKIQIRCNSCFEEYEEGFEICSHCGFIKGSPAIEPYYLYPGMILNDRYIIGQVLGSDGFSITYKAWDKNLETIVAIIEYYPQSLVQRIPGTKKIIVFSVNKQNEYNRCLMYFLDKARGMVKLSENKTFPQSLDFFEENGTAYYTMEYLDGDYIKTFINTNKDKKLDYNTAFGVFIELAEALEFMHGKGFLHCSVNPDNIFITTNGIVKLFVDWGTVLSYDKWNKKNNDTKIILIYSSYAPPEQYESTTVGSWTDIYALAATFYNIVSGIKLPESTNRKIGEKYIELCKIVPTVPQKVSDVINKALELNIRKRYKTVRKFITAMEKANAKAFIKFIKEASAQMAPKNEICNRPDFEKAVLEGKSVISSIQNFYISQYSATGVYGYELLQGQKKIYSNGNMLLPEMPPVKSFCYENKTELITVYNPNYKNIHITPGLKLTYEVYNESGNKVAVFEQVYENSTSFSHIAYIPYNSYSNYNKPLFYFNYLKKNGFVVVNTLNEWIAHGEPDVFFKYDPSSWVDDRCLLKINYKYIHLLPEIFHAYICIKLKVFMSITCL